MKIAVLLASYNRKEKTVACLQSLKGQQIPTDIQLEVFLTDDASDDGTAEAVQTIYPGINIYNGTGSLFWAGGMRNSWKKTLNFGFDYYLLLNDDTHLKPNAVSALINSAENIKRDSGTAAICIGNTVNSGTGEISYGGRKLHSKNSIKSYKVYSEQTLIECDLGNANIMLVPHEVVQKIGILSETFTHGIADYDYTLKAKKNGFAVMAIPGILGTCVDDHGKNWKPQDASLKERIQYLMSPTGLAYKEYLIFIKNHFPLHYPSAFIKLWMKTFFPFVWEAYKKYKVPEQL